MILCMPGQDCVCPAEQVVIIYVVINDPTVVERGGTGNAVTATTESNSPASGNGLTSCLRNGGPQTIGYLTRAAAVELAFEANATQPGQYGNNR